MTRYLMEKGPDTEYRSCGSGELSPHQRAPDCSLTAKLAAQFGGMYGWGRVVRPRRGERGRQPRRLAGGHPGRAFLGGLGDDMIP